MSHILDWLRRAASENDPNQSPSSKRLVFIVSALLLGPALIVFLAFKFDGATAVSAFNVWIGSVSFGYAGGKWADRGQSPPPESP